MMSIALATAFLFSSALPSQVDQPQTQKFSVGSLTGAAELAELRTAIFDVELPLSVRTASLDRYGALLKVGAAEAKVEEIVGNIRQFIEPKTSFHVEALSPAEISVTGTGEQHLWVYAFLEAADDEGFLNSLVDVQLLIYRIPTGNRQNLLGEATDAALTADELGKLRKKLSTIEGMEMVAAPRVLVNVGAAANISVIEETAYVKDYELTILPDMNVEIVDPVIGIVQEGLVLDLRALPVAKGTLMLQAELVLSSLKRPFQEEQRKITEAGGKVTIQIPEVRKVKVATRFQLKDGASVVLSAVDPGFEGEEEQDVLVIIGTSLVEKTDDE